MTHLYALTDSNSLDAKWIDNVEHDRPVSGTGVFSVRFLSTPEAKYIMEYKENKGGWKATGRVWAI